MRLSLKFPLLLALASVVLGTPLGTTHRFTDLTERHGWSEVPRGWVYESSAPADYAFALRIALAQHRIDELLAHLAETSDPSHVRYGQHLTPSHAESLVAAHPDSVSAVDEWLDHHGVLPEDIQRESGGGNWVTLRVTVAQAERMLGAKYGVYLHERTNERVARTLSYSLPRELHSHVGVVVPTTYFSTVHSMRATHFLQPEQKVDNVGFQRLNQNGVPEGCNHAITPACLRALYNTADYKVIGGARNAIGVAGYLDQYANLADLQTFFGKYRPDALGSKYTTLLVKGGGDDQSKPGVEANLDIQYTTGIAYPIPHIYYSTGGSPPYIPDEGTPTNTNEPYLDWLNFVLDQDDIPQVMTASYGDDEQTVPEEYARHVCNLFAQLGSRGTTVLFSSGDDGVGRQSCKTNDGTNKVLFQPTFPASCPFVTTVGATTRVNPEVVASFSGGGFSRYFPRPSYQNTAVDGYLKNLGATHQGLFNPNGRAYPDVAAQGIGFQVVVGGKVTSVGGTSASAPTVAAIIGLLNDFRMSQGKSSLGFINPLVYSNAASGFNDIVSGSNPGCNTTGFSAGPGWDPVTGLGTPDFLELQKFV